MAPNYREPFFADGNDTNIVECVGDVLLTGAGGRPADARFA
ncbi:MAG: hypothetical protein R6U63_14285 [Longimicrobiales bacterium]